MLTSDLCWDYYLGIVPMLSNYTSINELVSVWFYFIIIFIIEFVLMIFNMKIAFWWSVNGFWYENRITNKSSPSLSCHTSDKSFLLWKWNLWCIIWFSLWKWPFILYDSCYSRGASAPFHFMVGSSSGRRESETLGSLWITHSRNQTSPKPIIYVVIWIYDCWSTVNPIKVHEPLVSLASPRFRALPPTTNITLTLSNRYCSH